MDAKTLISKLVLLPMSKIYGMVVGVRNWMFNIGLLKSKEFDVPVIVVGNIAAGGTGKTPHVEYIVGLLQHSYHIGVVSRGYKRSTSGFIMATQRSTPSDIGDEPYQIYHKFDGRVAVAVCEDRVAGITELLRVDPKINLLVLDDAFQHRYVKPTVSVVLTEFNRPVFNDSLLPYGRLRESKRGLNRADIVIASKCNERTTAIDYHIFSENLGLLPYQRLFFTSFTYLPLRPVFPDQALTVPPSLDWLTDKDMVLAVAGIGNPKPFVKYIKHFKAKVKVNIFNDHHNFTAKDMSVLKQRFDSLKGVRNLMITTEKDAVRMVNCPYFPHDLKPYVYYLPINIKFMREDGPAFEETLRRTIKSKLTTTDKAK